MAKILIFLVLAIFCKTSTAGDWCGLPSCQGAQHIDCILGTPDSWGAKCPDDKNMLNLRTVQDMILDRQNTYRNNIAGGKVSGFGSANRMGTLSWNVTLANLARENVRQCLFKHDGCRNTPNFNYVGQNIAYKKYATNLNLKNIDVLLELVDSWYNEIKLATMAEMSQNDGNTAINEVSQMLKSYATRMGCAALKVRDSANTIVLFTCNYDMANIMGWPTYDEGPAASKCKAKNPDYPNLCSTAEVYNVNEFWLDYE